jgi:hypothetical protein
MGNLHSGSGTLQSTVAAAAGRQGEFLLQKCSGRCVHNPPVTPYDDTKTYDIVPVFAPERVLSISLVILMWFPI